MMKLTGLLFWIIFSHAHQVLADGNNSAKELMTLFTSASERVRLDHLRNSGKFDINSDARKMNVSVPREPDKVELKGVMIRGNGKSVVWINDGNTMKSNKIDQKIKVSDRSIKQDDLKVSIKVSQQRLKMKPGQQWNEVDNKVKDKYLTR